MGGRGFSGVRGAPRGLNNLRGLPSLPLGHLSNLKGALGCVIFKFEILPHITYFIQQGYFLSHEMDINVSVKFLYHSISVKLQLFEVIS